MKTLKITKLFALFLATLLSLKSYSQCAFVSPLVQVVNSKDSAGFCVQVVNLSVDIDVNNGNKYTYIHLWTTPNYHSLQPGYTYSNSNPPTTSNILGNNLLTIGLTYGPNTPISLRSTYPPDAAENVRVLDASDGITFSSAPASPGSSVNHVVFNNIRLVTPGACSPSLTYKGDAWSGNANNGSNAQCSLPGFVFATSDPSVTSTLTCAINNQQNILNFTVNANGAGNQISFQFDVYVNSNNTSAFDPTLDTRIYTGNTTYTITAGTANSSISFNSSTLPFYPPPYSTTVPSKYQDIYIVIKNIVIVNGGTTTNIDNDLVHVRSNNCQALPVTFDGISAYSKNGQLFVDWATLNEKNCKEYIVEATTDGVKWVALGTIASKATNGNSSQRLTYSHSVPISMVIGFGMMALLLVPVFKSRWAKVLIVIALITGAIACHKNQGKEVLEKDALFIRIAQYDIDGKVSYSDNVKVIKQ